MLQTLLNRRRLAKLPKTDLVAETVSVLWSAADYKSTVLDLIQRAQHRIVITALYLQADEAGEQILRALFAAKQQKPDLQVTVYVDYHRARRGLIGQEGARTNNDFYREIAKDYDLPIQIIGVPVKKRELFGVLHLKGFVFDQTLLYSGASLNNVYLAEENRYRADRYLVLQNQVMTDAIVQAHQQLFGDEEQTPELLDDEDYVSQAVKRQSRLWLKHAKATRYQYSDKTDSALRASLLMGLGRRNNELNSTVLALLSVAQQDVLIYTPYFNPPVALARALRKCLKRGVTVTIVVGDKTANDFYIPPGQRFSKIGGLPYFYETILRKFVRANQKFIDSGLLHVKLWKHQDNSYHLKGLSVDGVKHLFTGHNLNPRAFALDFENGIYVEDDLQQLKALLEQEKQVITAHASEVVHYSEIETVRDYPEVVQKLLSQLRRIGADLVVKRLI
ncbi:CDP-diacylglycerol--serine O-phosphatidyltransferase [Rheinheimera sp. MM224]|uniref:CDP-diacylglycerol--serine O-phosphatidyltransferase n=1 Tax=Rheinheimera sp. MM224 TaxID=3019969 RepID=UPI0021F8F1EA|nr:CDP-diacylglycerol--serine O-phosphatidyltransferase [Rheinheimera sp. MM224]CAI3805152.1 CDP-diacylglycerol--serine O-phosphatidyltransferase [Rheinheimera sp. MM224]